MAGQGEIINPVRSAVLLGDYVLNVMRHPQLLSNLFQMTPSFQF